MATDTTQVIAEVAVEPVDSDGSHRELVGRAIEALRGPELRVDAGALSTLVAGPVDEVLHAVQRAHSIVGDDAQRVVTTVRMESGGSEVHERAREVGA